MMLIGKKKTRKPTAAAVLAKSHSAPRASHYIAQTLLRDWEYSTTLSEPWPDH